MNTKKILKELRDRYKAIDAKDITVSLMSPHITSNYILIHSQGYITADEIQIIADITHKHNLVMSVDDEMPMPETGLILHQLK